MPVVLVLVATYMGVYSCLVRRGNRESQYCKGVMIAPEMIGSIPDDCTLRMLILLICRVVHDVRGVSVHATWVSSVFSVHGRAV